MVQLSTISSSFWNMKSYFYFIVFFTIMSVSINIRFLQILSECSSSDDCMSCMVDCELLIPTVGCLFTSLVIG